MRKVRAGNLRVNTEKIINRSNWLVNKAKHKLVGSLKMLEP